MRVRTRAVVGVSVAVCAVTLATFALAGGNPDPKRLVLQVSDVPAGLTLKEGFYRSNARAAQAHSEPISELVGRGRINGYGAEYTKKAALSAATKGPIEIDTFASVYTAAAGAHASLVHTVTRIGSHAQRQRLRTSLGDEAHLFRTTTTSGGVRTRIFIVYWRTGRLLAYVLAAGVEGGIDAESAIDLARRQQARMRRAGG